LSRVLLAIISVIFVVIFTGCKNNEASITTSVWKESGTVELTTTNDKGEKIKAHWLGEQGRLAISNSPFYAGQKQKYMWLLWGEKEEIVGNTLKVTAISENGDEETIWESNLVGTNWGATASSPSSLVLKTNGLWQLNAYVNNKLHGTIIVKVL
jgi:hypothetical protein